MIKIENIKTFGWEHAVRGMRNPMNSWDKSDSYLGEPFLEDFDTYVTPHVGPNDLNLMKRLAKAGTDHRKYLRMITVYCDITAPLYWWKEFDTYKVGTVANSCSTMHKIQAKEFTIDDFSHEHLKPYDEGDKDACAYQEYVIEHDGYIIASEKTRWPSLSIMNLTVAELNKLRDRYNETKDKKYWWQMIQLLPSSYNQKRTVMMNYEVLANIYPSRKNHKLDEWRDFCDWIKMLPYSELITGRNSYD